jgi:hypothetical protein
MGMAAMNGHEPIPHDHPTRHNCALKCAWIGGDVAVKKEDQ